MLMRAQRRRTHLLLPLLFLLLVFPRLAAAGEFHGQVTFTGLPVPGATVTATQGAKHLVTSTDQQGAYSFPDLAEGKWEIQVEMTGFAPLEQEVVIGPNTRGEVGIEDGAAG